MAGVGAEKDTEGVEEGEEGGRVGGGGGVEGWREESGEDEAVGGVWWGGLERGG